jgi:hypothetical protein
MIHEHESAPLIPGVRYDPLNSYPGADVLVKSEQTQRPAVAGGRL